MDASAFESESILLNALSFVRPPSINYIRQKKSVVFYSSGATVFPSNSSLAFRTTLTGQDWVDLSSIVFSMTVHATTDALTPRPHFAECLIQRVRVFGGGTLLEDVISYNRAAIMMNEIFRSTAVQEMYDAEGLRLNEAGDTPVAVNTKFTFLWRPSILGLLNSGKCWPLAFAPLQFEITFTTDAGNAVSAGTAYSIENVECRCNLLTLDSTLHSKFVNDLLQNKTLSIVYRSIATQQTSGLTQGDVAVTITRSFSRLSQIFMFTFKSNEDKDPGTRRFPNSTFISDIDTSAKDDNFSQWAIQLGSRMLPVDSRMVNSIALTHYFLRECVGMWNHELASMNLPGRTFIKSKHIMGVDLNRAPMRLLSGISTRSSDLLTCMIKNINTVDTLMITLVYDAAVVIGMNSCSSFT